MEQSNPVLAGRIAELERQLSTKTAECNAVSAQALLLKDALSGLMSGIGGGNKSCGHEFSCICATDKARKALSETPIAHIAKLQLDAFKNTLELGLTPEQYHLLKYSRDGLALQVNAIKDAVRANKLGMCNPPDDPSESYQAYTEALMAVWQYAEQMQQGGMQIEAP